MSPITLTAYYIVHKIKTKSISHLNNKIHVKINDQQQKISIQKIDVENSLM